MKKFLLSSFVILIFSAYSIHQRFGNDDAPVIAPADKKSITSQPPLPSITSSAVSSTKPTANSTPQPTKKPSGLYKDGKYTGDSVDAYYGFIQVAATITDGKITDVQFLDYPHDRNNSIRINTQAMPYLKQEAIQAQSAKVDIISGATASSEAFRQSLQSALNKAKN